jgi:hypothetical protein
MIVVFVAVAVAFTLFDLLSLVVVNDTIRVIISIFLTGFCILGYKIRVLGYGFKCLTSMLSSYKVILPIITFAASFFVQDAKLLIVQIILTIAGGVMLTKWQINTTKHTFFNTESIGEYDRYFLLMKYRRRIQAIRFPKFKFKFAEKRKKLEQQKLEEREQLRRETQQLKEEREYIEKLKAQLENEKREMNNKREQESVGFFDGCKNEEEIKARYRKLVQEYHPDGARGNAEMFKKIQAEYERWRSENK